MASKKLTTEVFVKKALEVHGSKYDYSNTVFTKSSVKLEIICKDHGSFWQLPHSHLSGHGCAECRKWSLAEFLRKAKEVHADRYNYDEVIITGVFNKVKIKCSNHGIFEQSVAAHLRLKQGCPICSYEEIPERHSHHRDLFVDKATAVHGDKYDYSKVDYVRSRFKVEIICKEHGSFFMTPNNHLRGESCGKCIPGGFQPQFPGYVYILKSENKVKIGITNKDPLKRMSYINSTSSNDIFELVYCVLFQEGRQAQCVEKQMLSHFRAIAKTDDKEKFSGYTECFVELDVQDVINKLKEIS